MRNVSRRRSIGLLAGMSVWPIAAHAQPSGLPRIGYLSGRSYATDAHLLQAFREGLKSTGFVDGQNVMVDVRWADGRYDQVPAMMAELVATKPNVIAAVGGNPVGLAAKAATSTIPVVFSAGADPVEIGLVGNFNRPGGNLTGITLWASELDAKRLDLLHEMVPAAHSVAVLVNPTNPGAVKELQGATDAAAKLGLALDIQNAASSSEIERAFLAWPAGKVDAVAVIADAFLINQRRRIMALVGNRRLPAIYPSREFVDDGGLASYGARWADMYRIVGVYAGRILKGEKPGDLPIQRPTTYELVINQRTAKSLGLTLPSLLLARASEVID
jgi:putative tryptophan/tyrosine transport system substrate-binding protein